MSKEPKLTKLELKNQEYEKEIKEVEKRFTWDIVKSITLKEMTDAVENINVDRIIMPTAKSTGKSRFVAIYIIYMFYKDPMFNAIAGRKRKIDNPKIITIVKRAIDHIEQAIGMEIMHHFEFQESFILTRMIFKRKLNRTHKDQVLHLFSFDQPDSTAGLAPQYGYFGVLWLEEPVQQIDTSGISAEEYLLTYLTIVDTIDRFALEHNKRFIQFATMNGWDPNHFFIKLAEVILPWDDFLEWASQNFHNNNILLKIKDSDAVIRATKYCNPIIKGDEKQYRKLEDQMTYDEGRAIALGQIVEGESGDDQPYLLPLSQYGGSDTIFELNNNHIILDVDYGYDHGTWAAEVITEVIKYGDKRDGRIKMHFNDIFIVWNEMIVKKQKQNRVPEVEIEKAAAEWLKDKRYSWTNDSTIGYDYADATSMRNIENLLTKKYNVTGLDFIQYNDKNKKGVFDVQTREQQNLSALNNKLLTFSPRTYQVITDYEVGQPWSELRRNGKDYIDKSDRNNKDDVLESFERAARHYQEELGEKYGNTN